MSSSERVLTERRNYHNKDHNPSIMFGRRRIRKKNKASNGRTTNDIVKKSKTKRSKCPNISITTENGKKTYLSSQRKKSELSRNIIGSAKQSPDIEERGYLS